MRNELVQDIQAPDGPVLVNTTRVEDKIWTGEAPAGWHRAAREWSRTAGGQIWPTQRGMTWRTGNRSIYVLSKDAYADALAARRVCDDLGVKPALTVGACAREILEWVAAPSTSAGADLLDGGKIWGYHDCTPGQYPDMTLWDIQSCYWTLFSRLPSLRVVPLSRSGITWEWFEEDEESRFNDVCAVVAREKSLRNIMVGSCYGSKHQRAFYSGGRRRLGPRLPGPFPSAAALVIRTAWELCREAAEQEGSIYSCVDSVCVSTDRKADSSRGPALWRAVGLNPRVKARGDSEICGFGIYKVGEKCTLPYQEGHRQEWPVPRIAAPKRMVYREWLS